MQRGGGGSSAKSSLEQPVPASEKSLRNGEGAPQRGSGRLHLGLAFPFNQGLRQRSSSRKSVRRVQEACSTFHPHLRLGHFKRLAISRFRAHQAAPFQRFLTSSHPFPISSNFRIVLPSSSLLAISSFPARPVIRSFQPPAACSLSVAVAVFCLRFCLISNLSPLQGHPLVASSAFVASPLSSRRAAFPLFHPDLASSSYHRPPWRPTT